MKQVEFEVFPAHTIHYALFDKVTNAAHIMSELRAGRVSFSLLNPLLIVDQAVILAAANKAMHASLEGKLTTKSIHSELIFNISPSKNISDSYRKFGLQESGTCVIVALFDASPERLQEVYSLVKGEEVPIETLSKLCNFEQIAKEYQCTNKGVEALQKEVLNSIAIKAREPPSFHCI